MADMPDLDEREFAEDLGFVSGKRGLPETLNPWPEEPKGAKRVLHFRWRRGYHDGKVERAAHFRAKNGKGRAAE